MSELTMKYNPAFLNDETLIRTFVVRHREFAAVMESVRDNTSDANQHVLVIGPRGSGKSTLVLRVAAEIRQDPELKQLWYPVVYGEESYLVTNAGEFWLEALLQVAEQTGEDRWHEAHAGLLKEPDSDRLAHRALAQLMDFADERGVRLLFVVENLHQLVESQINDDDEMWAIRKKLQTEPRVMLLGTATRRFDQIDNENQALYEFFRLIELDPLDSLDEIGDLWRLAGNEHTPRAFLRPVEILTGGNPRLIRILSEFAAKTSFQELMDNLVHLMDEHTEYFKHHLDKLAPTERKVFVALADRWDPGTASDIAEVARMQVSAVSSLLNRLEKRRVVRVVDQRGRTKVYQVAERLYNVYHLMRRRGQASARVKAAVRFMVRYYEGDRLVPAIRSLVQEASVLNPTERKHHYLAYDEVLDLVTPSLRDRIMAETRDSLLALPDVPSSLRQRLISHSVESSDEFEGWSLDALLEYDTTALDAATLERFAWSLFGHISLASDSTVAAQAGLSTIERTLEHAPQNPTLHMYRGSVLFFLERYADSLRAFDQAVQLDPDLVNAWRGKADALGALGQREEALATVRRAIELDPEDIPTRMSQIAALLDLGRTEKALDTMAKVEDLPFVRATRASVLRKAGRLEDALADLDWLVKSGNLDAEIYVTRSRVLYDLGRLDEALEDAERSAEMNPGYATARSGMIAILSSMNRRDEALSLVDVYMKLYPEELDFYMQKSALLMMEGRVSEALGSLDKASGLGMDSPLHSSGRGVALELLGRREEALAAYNHAIRLDDSYAPAYRGRGTVLSDMGRSQEARVAYEQAVELEPDNPNGWRLLASEILATQGDAAMLEVLDRAKSHISADAPLWIHEGEALTRLGRFEEALSALGNGIALPNALDVVEETTALSLALAAFIDSPRVLSVLRDSALEDEVEPLIVALRQDAGEDVEVAQEIAEVARDLRDQIEALRSGFEATESE